MSNRAGPKADVLQGTLDLMVLQTLDSLGRLHGYAIAARLEQLSSGALQLNMGTLYPAFDAAGAAWPAPREVGHYGDQSQGEVLQRHVGRPASARQGKRRLGPDVGHHPHGAARRGMTQEDRMRVLREWIHRLWGTLLPSRRDADLEEKLRLHLAMAAEEARRRGLEPADAVRAARIEAGGASQAMDTLRA